MPRLALAAVSSFALLAFCAYSLVTTWVFPKDTPLKGFCEAWLERPVPSWVSLKECQLDVNLVVLESDQGDFEKLANRQKGVSLKPYPVSPTWIAAWVPMRSRFESRAGLVRAAYRIQSQDLLEWVNKLERADEKERDRMWADPGPLRRVSRPGLLQGRAAKPAHDGLQKSLGPSASVHLLTVLEGVPPPPAAPTFGILAGLGGLLALGYFLRRLGRGGSLEEATAEQQITQVNVSDVKLEIGALEELRAEERRQRKQELD